MLINFFYYPHYQEDYTEALLVRALCFGIKPAALLLLFQEMLKRKLLVPFPTHWNSYYDAVERVVENPLADLNDVFAKLALRGFNERKIMF